MRAMILKEFRELRRDPRTMAMLIVLPLLLLVIFGYAANFYVSSVKTAVVGPTATQVAQSLPGYFDVTDTYPDRTAAEAKDLLRENEVDVAVVAPAGPGEQATAFVDGRTCSPPSRASGCSTSSATGSTSRSSSTRI